MLPNFLIIGSQKSGTTSLYYMLKNHPSIYMPETKEVNFFFHDHLFSKGTEYYESFFSQSPRHHVRGEASPGYICHPEVPRRIFWLLPDIKLIVIVRNPVERAYSQYWDNRRRLAEHRAFGQLVRSNLLMPKEYEPGKIGYFSRGLYMKYINNYLRYFSRDRLLVLVFDDLVENPDIFLKSCLEFLGVANLNGTMKFGQPQNVSSVWGNPLYKFFFNHPTFVCFIPGRCKSLLFWGKRRTYQYPPMKASTRQILLRFYAPWNRELSKFLNRDLLSWNK